MEGLSSSCCLDLDYCNCRLTSIAMARHWQGTDSTGTTSHSAVLSKANIPCRRLLHRCWYTKNKPISRALKISRPQEKWFKFVLKTIKGHSRNVCTYSYENYSYQHQEWQSDKVNSGHPDRDTLVCCRCEGGHLIPCCGSREEGLNQLLSTGRQSYLLGWPLGLRWFCGPRGLL